MIVNSSHPATAFGRFKRHQASVATCLLLASFSAICLAQVPERVVDVQSRPGVTQRFLFLSPQQAKAAVVLFPGGHGGLQISDKGKLKWGGGNFLVRTRQMFAAHDLMVAVVDAPSDRQSPPHLGRFRQTAEHAADIKATIAWLREQAKVPVWLVGTSAGTQSAAFVATQLTGKEGPDGLILSSTILVDTGRPVPDMDFRRLKIPVLVVHHEQDSCKATLYRDIPRLMQKLERLQRKELLTFKGGENRGDPCEAFAHHGFNGLERDVVAQMSRWILDK